jgi:transcriptional regulator with GAF, ATPase, and Fis domain
MGGPKIRFPELEGVRIRESFIDDSGKLKDLERTRILEALRKTGGKVGGKDGAATLLGLNRTTLIHRMKKLGIRVKQNKTVLDSVAEV